MHVHCCLQIDDNLNVPVRFVMSSIWHIFCNSYPQSCKLWGQQRSVTQNILRPKTGVECVSYVVMSCYSVLLSFAILHI